MYSIKINNLKNVNNIKIIDIRSATHYNAGHLKGAINIPYYDLLNNYSKYLNKKETYYIYCNYGIKSIKMCELLDAIGYNVINIEDGYDNYKNK